MSDNCLLMDAIGYVDDAYLKKYFSMKETFSTKKQNRKRNIIIKWSAVAACLCLIVVLSSIIIPPYIPTEYNLSYSYVGDDGKEIYIPESNTWIYYVQNNHVKRERVKLPCSAQNIFLTWKHLNNIGDEVKLIKCEILSNGSEYITNFDGHDVANYDIGDYFVLDIVISKNIENYVNKTEQETLFETLKKSMTSNSSIDFDEVNISIE